MGLDIPTFTILGGLATLNDLYGHARDIRITKESSGVREAPASETLEAVPIFKLECIFHIYKRSGTNDTHIHSIYISKDYTTDFLTKTWEDVYTVVKEKLDTLGIEYINNF